MPTLWRTMWTKYDYLCTNCDALYEITTLQTIPDCFEPECACGSKNVIGLGVSDGNAPIITDVTSITPTEVVKINSNPYN
jgi:hypothetical protein